MAYKYEISVRAVTRYIVGEYHTDGEPQGACGWQGCGEFDNPRMADEAAHARAAWRKEQGDEASIVRLSGDLIVSSTINNKTATLRMNPATGLFEEI